VGKDALLTVRSTAASGVGVMISAGAALFLAVWWGRDIRRRRRARHPASG
jgi:HAMP domain-containing protein